MTDNWDEAAARARLARIDAENLERTWATQVPTWIRRRLIGSLGDLRHAFAKIDAQEAEIERLRADLVNLELGC